jgi:hypothetical protein
MAKVRALAAQWRHGIVLLGNKPDLTGRFPRQGKHL